MKIDPTTTLFSIPSEWSSLKTHNLCRDHGKGWQLRTHELKLAMGCAPGPKGGIDWPPEGIPPTLIGNVWVWVYPRGSGSKHRSFATCPACNSTIPAGRLHQHLNTKACREAAAKP